MSNTFTGKVSGRMSSRGWAIALGIGAVVLAAILLVVYLDRYRARVGGRNAPTPVLVAKRLIPNGTPGNVVATQGMYAPTTLPQQGSRGRGGCRSGISRRPGSGRRHLPGPAAHRDGLRRERYRCRRLADHGYRARDLAISIDNVHGISSQVMPGDSRRRVHRVERHDVKLFEPNVKVLTTPTVPGPAGGGNLILQIDTKDAAKWLFAADNT